MRAVRVIHPTTHFLEFANNIPVIPNDLSPICHRRSNIPVIPNHSSMTCPCRMAFCLSEPNPVIPNKVRNLHEILSFPNEVRNLHEILSFRTK